jgi:hypothetical protein
MGIGIVEPSQKVVPGTVQLYDNEGDTSEASTTHLKHTPDGKTVLAPQVGAHMSRLM